MNARMWLPAMILIGGLLSVGTAGTPKYVAGASYFDPAVKGMAVTWAQGRVSYYTDQGSLSALLPQANADSLVADSFSRWTSIATAAVSVAQAGQLSEDVNGTNVSVDASGAITVPADIQPTAIDKPVAIVYDNDGAVTDAFLGSGAGLSGNCFTNAVFGGVDHFTTDGHFGHALVIINGNCAQTSSDLPELQYRLVRVLGQVLGVGWSQLNLNVITGKPQPPTTADRAGFPLMHYTDSIQCVPITRCYTSPDQPKGDDQAQLSQLYPVTTQNQSLFPGKVIFADGTARISGSVFFVDSAGQPAQPMQGVNVVARWVDPNTNQASRQYAVSSVSGFSFRGNAGNEATGFLDATGQPQDRFGSDDVSLEGFFDLAGLQIPNGGATATYELTTEALDSIWSEGVGPYSPWQVQPSGTTSPIRVIVTKGRGIQQDIFMTGSAARPSDPREPETFTQPAVVPNSGEWAGSFSGYGDSDYFWFTGQANRTMSVEALAVDEAGKTTEGKARPVIGMWSLAAPAGSAPGAATPKAFNASIFGLSRLDAVLLQSTNFRIGLFDERGDGRPDYGYRARVLYGDKVTPARVNVAGGSVFAVSGMGFRPGMNLAIGSTAANILTTSSTQIVAIAPPMADGIRTVAASDPNTGGATVLTDALTCGAGPDDRLLLLMGSNPPTPAGTQALNPVRVQVVTADGLAGVAGATVVFSSTPAAILSACGGSATCSVLTDETGQASTLVTPPGAGVYTITALLAPASYDVPQSVQAIVSATSSASDIAVLSGYRWMASGASIDAPVVARVVSNGAPTSGQAVTFSVNSGTATLTSSTATTDASGYATTTLQVRNLAGMIQLSACVAPAGAPCATMRINRVLPGNIKLEAVAGSAQLIMVGQAFQPIVVRATDSSVPPNPVEGVPVSFSSTVFRPDLDVFDEPVGETEGGTTSMPVILGSTQASIASDARGLASITPSAGGVSGAAEVEVLATAGSVATQFFELESMEPVAAGQAAQGKPTATAPPSTPGRYRSRHPSMRPRLHVPPE